MKSQDDIDTAPIIVKGDANVEFESIDLGPGERAEIILAPERAMRSPALFMSNSDRECKVTIEQIIHGRSPIFTRGYQEIDSFRFGQPTNLTITTSEPIKIIVVNAGERKTVVGASLVTNSDPKVDTTYHLTSLQPEDLRLGSKTPEGLRLGSKTTEGDDIKEK
jgi:hypothetical protein